MKNIARLFIFLFISVFGSNHLVLAQSNDAQFIPPIFFLLDSNSAAGSSCLVDPGTCSTSLLCETAICQANGSCSISLNANQCLIGGLCYTNGDNKPGNECLVCASNTTPLSWSNSTSSCNDNNICTENDSCSNGQCTGSPILDNFEPNDVNVPGIVHDLGSISASNDWVPGDISDFTASLYPTGDTDWYQYTITDHLAYNIHPRVILSNIPAGKNYQLCAYYQCSGNAPLDSIDCAPGASPSSPQNGLSGCCSSSGSTDQDIKFTPVCDASNNDGTVSIQVKNFSSATCQEYSIEWGNDR